MDPIHHGLGIFSGISKTDYMAGNVVGESSTYTIVDVYAPVMSVNTCSSAVTFSVCLLTNLPK